MGISSILKVIAKMVGETFIDDVKDHFDESLDDAKDKMDVFMAELKVKVEVIVEQAVKKLIVFSLVLVGLIFGLTGLAMYLSETISALNGGLGYVLVGGVIVLLGALGAYFSK